MCTCTCICKSVCVCKSARSKEWCRCDVVAVPEAPTLTSAAATCKLGVMSWRVMGLSIGALWGFQADLQSVEHPKGPHGPPIAGLLMSRHPQNGLSGALLETPQIVGLLTPRHPQKGPPTDRNSRVPGQPSSWKS